MPNLLVIPEKGSHPVDIRSALRSYIHEKHPETHPDAFEWDISHWEECRSAAVGSKRHEESIPAIIAYHTQLVFALTKLPNDVGLGFTYDAMFTPRAIPLTLANITYERLCLLISLASLFSQIASEEDRSNTEGIRRAVIGFARAAGTLSYIISNALPAFRSSLKEQHGLTLPPELDEDTLVSFRFLMLAQGQECAWQKAGLDKMKDGILARLAAEASSLYQQSLKAITRTPGYDIPKSWISHITAKTHHFEAVAQYRMSKDDNLAKRYGLEIARLQIAQAAAQKAVQAAQTRGVARPVLDDAKVHPPPSPYPPPLPNLHLPNAPHLSLPQKSLEAHLQKTLKEADRLNDLIFNNDVPSSASVPSIQGTAIVKEEIPAGLVNPARSAGGGGSEMMFAGLEGWGITRAVEIFKNRRENWINDELVETQHELDQAAASTLNAMHLPASLDALSQPIGLPPSLLTHAEQVRQEDGPVMLKKMFKDLKRLADNGHALIENCFDLLDAEAQQDEEIREGYGKYDDEWNRPPSAEANKELAEELQRHNRMLTQAKKTDKNAKGKWEEWGNLIRLLGGPESELEAAVPKTTYSPTEALSSTTRTSTQLSASALRQLLEDLSDIKASRSRTIQRANRMALTDDIKPKILRYAADKVKDQWVDIDPGLFDGVVEEAMGKYDGFKEELVDNGRRQEELLERIAEENQKFLESRKVDPSIKDRENALQNLEYAYLEYLNIKRHLEEGSRFYNDFAEAVSRIKGQVQAWVDDRHQSIKWLLDSLEPVNLDEEEEEEVPVRAQFRSPTVERTAEATPPIATTSRAPIPPQSDTDRTSVDRGSVIAEPEPEPKPKQELVAEPPLPARSKSPKKKTRAKPRPASPEPEPEAPASDPIPEPVAPAPAPLTTPGRKGPLRLPNPNSAAWQATELPPAPRETPKSTRTTRSRAREAAS